MPDTSPALNLFPRIRRLKKASFGDGEDFIARSISNGIGQKELQQLRLRLQRRQTEADFRN